MINSNWIPMTEHLPPIEQDVLVYTFCGMMKVWSRNDTDTDFCFWEDEYGYWAEKDEVIAWMDLPDPPNIKKV